MVGEFYCSWRSEITDVEIQSATAALFARYNDATLQTSSNGDPEKVLDDRPDGQLICRPH